MPASGKYTELSTELLLLLLLLPASPFWLLVLPLLVVVSCCTEATAAELFKLGERVLSTSALPSSPLVSFTLSRAAKPGDKEPAKAVEAVGRISKGY